MEKKMTFNYFYGTEADQFSFYRIPKALFTDSYFTLDKKEWKKYESQCIFVSTEKNMQHVYSGLNVKYIEYDRYQ